MKKSKKSIESQSKQLDGMAEDVLAGGKLLTAKDRLRYVKPRSGGPETVRLLAELAVRHGLVKSVPVKTMLAKSDEARSFAPLLASASHLERAVHDRVIEAEGEAWSIALAIYRQLQAVAVTDLRLAADLAPITAQFAKKRKAEPPSAPPPTETPTPSK